MVTKPLKILMPMIGLLLLIAVASAHAAIDNAGLLDNVLTKYATAATTWAAVITSAATRLYWTLVVISMVWTFGIIALKRADLGEFFAEFFRFTVFVGFFWWLLSNGPAFATSIYQSLKILAGNATGLGPGLSPSGIVDVGFDIFGTVLDQSSVWSPVDSFAGITIAAIILVILALVGINMVLLLCAGWILAYAGVFFLGFGGSRWTSDMAISYYKTVLAVAAQLMTMVLLVGIGKTFLDDYYTNMSSGVSLKEMGVLLIVSVVLLMLVNKLPALISGIITGASVGHAGIGTFGAGAAAGAAGMAIAAAATGGAMLAAGAANTAGGMQAVMAAFSKASESESSSSESDFMASSGGSAGGETTNLGGGGGSESTNYNNDSSSTPFAEAAGFSSDGFSLGKTGRIVAGAGANLAQGAMTVAKNKASNITAKARGRISETTGGKIAAAINSSNDTVAKTAPSSPTEPTFTDNTLSAASNLEFDSSSEVAAFRDREIGNT